MSRPTPSRCSTSVQARRHTAHDEELHARAARKRVTEFISNQDSIYAKDSVYLKEYLDPPVVERRRPSRTVIYYRVKSGDTLGAIARRNHVTTSQLMRWNGIKNPTA